MAVVHTDDVAWFESAFEGYTAWMAEEDPLVIAERTWERAVAIVNGSPTLLHDADHEVVLGVPQTVPYVASAS